MIVFFLFIILLCCQCCKICNWSKKKKITTRYKSQPLFWFFQFFSCKKSPKIVFYAFSISVIGLIVRKIEEYQLPISSFAYFWRLFNVSDIFSSQNEKNKKRVELLRWYARERSVISKDWGLSAAILWLHKKKTDDYQDFPADLVVHKYFLVLV
jgi:hypothetical protein